MSWGSPSSAKSRLVQAAPRVSDTTANTVNRRPIVMAFRLDPFLRWRGLEWAERLLPEVVGDAYLLYNTACIFSLAGNVEQAVTTLEMSYAAGLGNPEWMQHDSDLDPLRDHPRFQALMGRMIAGQGP